MSALARQLVEHPRWRWEAGMRVIATRPFSGGEPRLGRLNVRPHGLVVAWDDGSYWSPSPDDLAAWALDLTDPATAGVLLGWLPSGWSVFDRLAIDGGRSVVIKLRGAVSIAYEGPSIGESAASALLALWGPA